MTHSTPDDFERFDSVPCNTEVYLQLLTPTQPIRLRTRLIGIHSRRAVLLEFGSDRHWLAAKPYIKEDRGVIVRLLNSDDPSGHVFAFRSTISRIMSAMYQWIVLDYPRDLEQLALRQHSRLQVNVPAQLQANDSTHKVSDGHICDISIGGGAFIGKDLGEDCVDKHYSLKFTDDRDGRSTVLPVTIKNQQFIDAENNLTHYGLVLNCSQQETEALVQRVILRHLIQELPGKQPLSEETKAGEDKGAPAADQ
ncbi:PilZ domain-containing protein [Shewanella cyperi]|uniref:PilZ domain-containing protein n=1 Tax=Shewanella cyperi TaxID=2814292 RepID=UPI001A94B06C|nr:PilZ domain-containing protein [Shewanella cyperi]QSX40817.1 flagellar brake protein [Shewanella cyperi]